MSDLQLLFLVLALLYLWECACWINRRSMVFRSWLGARWRHARPSSLLGNQRGGFVFSNPFPPLGSILTSNASPILLSPEAVMLADRSPKQGRVGNQTLRWNELQPIEQEGKKVVLKGGRSLRLPSIHSARRMTEILSEMTRVNPSERHQLIRRYFQARLDCVTIQTQWEKFRKLSKGLLYASNGLFGYLFILSPLVIYYGGLRRSWPFLIAGLFMLTASIATLFYRVHQTLFPEADDERFSHFVVFLLSPATAIRARDTLSRPLLEMHHPVAMAKVFCDRPVFEELAGQYVRELQYRSGKGDPQEVEEAARQIERKVLEEFLRAQGLDPARLLQAPRPLDETCLSYCPHCLEQFTLQNGVCGDCGAPLQSFAPAVPGGAAS